MSIPASILLDSRVGSSDLLPAFQSHRTSPSVSLTTLTAGDIAFTGEGPNGPCLVGIERKRLVPGITGFSDLPRSIRTGRFSGEQLIKLVDHYEYSWLLVEGRYKTGPDGSLLVPYGSEWRPALQSGANNFSTLEMNSFLNTISLKTPVRIYFSPSAIHTVEFVMGLAHSFSKPWDQHHAHMALHTPAPVATLGKASTVRRVAFALSGVGWERSAAAASHFHSVAGMLGISSLEEDERKALIKLWRKIPGFGAVLSARVVAELLGEYNPGGDLEL